MRKNILSSLALLAIFISISSYAEQHPFQGTHVLGELYGVQPALLNNLELLESTLKQGIQKSGATYIGTVSEKFTPQGVTILILIAESHVSIHTYPEYNAIFFDAFTCGECDPRLIAEVLIATLKPEREHINVIQRGI